MAATPPPSVSSSQPGAAATPPAARAPGKPGPKPGTPRAPRAPVAPAGAGSTSTPATPQPAPARAPDATGAASGAAGTGAPPAEGPAMALAPEARPSRRVGPAPASLEKTVPATAVVKVVAQAKQPRKAWWVGTLAGAPVENVTVGGISFPRRTDLVGTDGDGQTTRSSRPGAIVHLTDAEVARIHKALPNKVVRSIRRPDGTVSRAALYDVRGTPDVPFSPGEGDEPLARFVFMQRVPDFDQSTEG